MNKETIEQGLQNLEEKKNLGENNQISNTELSMKSGYESSEVEYRHF